MLISILTLFYCNFWCTSHFNTPTLIRSALELKMTLLLINKQSKNNINTGCSYCTEPSTNLSLLRYFSSFRAVWYGVCARSWTELMLFKKGSRSHKKVRLILDYMSHKWLHCQIQGGIIGRRRERGSRFKAFIRGANQRDQPFNIKKNMGMLCARMLLLLFYNSSLHHHHYDCNSIGSEKKCQKLLSSVLKEIVKLPSDMHLPIISLTHFLITFNLIYCFSHFVFFQWRSVKYITWCWWWLSSCCSSSISCVLKTTFLGITTKINRSIPWMMIAPLFSWRVFCNSITTTTTTTTSHHHRDFNTNKPVYTQQ